VLILAILGFGIIVGALAQFILGREGGSVDWGIAIIAGIGGSFVGGLLLSLISGDGLDLKASGLIGSVLGAVIITAIWRWFTHRHQAQAKAADAAAAKASRSGRHH
jgi:uncharacterized membrane protein YeaQ/YmgE (transglycosylase-associated protein family)